MEPKLLIKKIIRNRISLMLENELNDNFWKWFGNSKVVDDSGNPLVCYHGTPKGGFVEFKPKPGSKSKASQQVDIGSHFSIDKEYSAGYAGKKKTSKTYEVYLKIENPLYTNELIFREDGEEKFIKFDNFLKDLFGRNYKKMFSRGDYFWNKNYTEKMPEVNQLILTSFAIDNVPPNKLYNTLISHGYDGVFHEPYNMVGLSHFQKHPKAYIVLSPNQIKAVENNGEWSLDNNDIYKQ